MMSWPKGQGSQGIRYDSTETFVLNSVTIGVGFFKIVKNCVTSLMDWLTKSSGSFGEGSFELYENLQLNLQSLL